MKLKPGWLLLALPILLLLSLILSSVPKVPTYQARTYYYWVTYLGKYQRGYNGAEVEKASAAIRAMGTNALPCVMADLRARAGMKDRVISWLAPRAPFLNLKPANVS